MGQSCGCHVPWCPRSGEPELAGRGLGHGQANLMQFIRATWLITGSNVCGTDNDQFVHCNHLVQLHHAEMSHTGTYTSVSVHIHPVYAYVCVYMHVLQVRVMDVDTGRTLMVPLSDVRHLPPSHSLSFAPPLAIPCSLHGVCSAHLQGWWPLDCQLLWKLTNNKEVGMGALPCSPCKVTPVARNRTYPDLFVRDAQTCVLTCVVTIDMSAWINFIE